MKIFAFLLIVAVFFSIASTIVKAQNDNAPNIIPQPKSLTKLNGEFKFNYKTKIVATDAAGRKSAGILNDLLLKNYGFKLPYTEKLPKQNAIVFAPQDSAVKYLSPEGYGLMIAPKSIQINGNETGQFYALQTLMQILPTDFKGETVLPCVDIADEPRFKYRGMHLDVSRHFMPVEFVKKYIDLMSQYKFNFFHWHLTEDQGWRIEIKKYPRLTEIGSKRAETMKERNFDPYIGDGIPVEGFYTQEQTKDVAAYAKARKITVIPEIELPGHSSAALAAYPNLGCKENYDYKVQTKWGIFKEVYCPKEETFQFLEDVISEVIDLFPDSPYIHIGGDEVLHDFWKESSLVQDLKTKLNLKDEHEVQSYFTQRIEKFINSKGKKIIGWDEILEGGIAPNATVMSWRGEKGGILAAKAGHDVIMTPTDYLYFDYGQGDTKYEPLNIGGYVTLEKVYSYNPQPKELTPEEAKHILGAQGNVWTEYLKKPESVEYMAFPRMLALSEIVWSPLESKNFADFQQRLKGHFPRLDKQNINYRIPEPAGLENRVLNSYEKTIYDLTSLIKNGKIFFTTDGSTPDEKSKVYEKPFEIELKPTEKVELKTIVVNAKGRKSSIYAATVLRREMLVPAEVKDKKEGVIFSVMKGKFGSVGDVDRAAVTLTGETKSIGLAQFSDKTNKLTDDFGIIFDGYLNVPTDGIYEFALASDGGAAFVINEEAIVDLKRENQAHRDTGIIPLKKGFHKFRLKYFKVGEKPSLSLTWGIKGTPLRRINSGELVH